MLEEGLVLCVLQDRVVNGLRPGVDNSLVRTNRNNYSLDLVLEKRMFIDKMIKIYFMFKFDKLLF